MDTMVAMLLLYLLIPVLIVMAIDVPPFPPPFPKQNLGIIPISGCGEQWIK